MTRPITAAEAVSGHNATLGVGDARPAQGTKNPPALVHVSFQGL